jgi:hypothetical protein
LSVNNFLCKYTIKHFSPPRLCTQFSGNSQSELMNIDGKACNNIPEAVNKLALSARLGHSCEIWWNNLHRKLLTDNFLSYDTESAK